MIKNPNKAVEKGWIRLSKHSAVQQSGIDVSLTKEIDRILPSGKHERLALPTILHSGIYEFNCNEYIKVPQDCVAIIFVRSGWNRRGAFITTGLYDNGFKNFIQGILHVEIPVYMPAFERIAQVVFFQTEHKAQYLGKYQDDKSGKPSIRKRTYKNSK